MKTLFLAWQDPDSRSWFPIGQLTYDGETYKFVYTHGAKQATDNCQFQALLSFPDLNEVYTSNKLFPLFSNRLMPQTRLGYKHFIQSLNIPLHEDDPIAILSRSGGRKATDSLEVFPSPKPDENDLYHIHFFAHGLRHLPKCSIERIYNLKAGERLLLSNEFQNPYDPNALTLNTEDHLILGYCPRYLAHDFLQLALQNPKLLHVHVERINPVPTPLQHRLLCNMTAQWHKDFIPFSGEEYKPIQTQRVSTVFD